MKYVWIIAGFVLLVFLQIITMGTGNRLNAEISNNQYETPADTVHCKLLYQTTAVKEIQNGEIAYGKRDGISEVGCDYYKNVDVLDIERTALKWDISRIPLYPNIKIVSADFKFNSGIFQDIWTLNNQMMDRRFGVIVAMVKFIVSVHWIHLPVNIQSILILMKAAFCKKSKTDSATGILYAEAFRLTRKIQPTDMPGLTRVKKWLFLTVF